MNETERMEGELSRRILFSERMRALILAYTFSAIIPVLIMFLVLAIRKAGFVSVYPIYGIFGLCVVGTCYEWWSVRKLGRAIREEKTPERVHFYLNAMLEIATPALIIFIAADNTSPVNPISGPFSYLFFLFIILSPLRLDFGLCLFTGFLASALYSLLIVHYWEQLAKVWEGPPISMYFNYGARILLFAVGGIVAAFVTYRIRSILRETMAHWMERERIVGLFGQHVSPVVVNQLLSQSADFSESRSVCVLVLDIRNFTTFSEHRSAEEVVAYLNTLWGHCVRIINEHQGSVNKFLGDGFLAVFGAPVSLENNAKEALAASREILQVIDQLIADKKLPPTDVGMALHAGEVIAGTIGSSEKKEYTVIGDVVNVAFRIEALNKNFSSKLLISDVVAKAAEAEGLESLPPILVKGRDEPVALFRVV